MSRLEARNIEITYRANGKKRLILQDFNIQIEKGEVVAFIGSNGTGKSSLLRVLSGLQNQTKGTVLWNDTVLTEIAYPNRPKHLSNLFSNYARVDGFSVYDLVALGRQPYTGIFGKLNKEDEHVIVQSLLKVGMSTFVKNPIGTLSDGEFRKVMLAKMLAQNTPIMILDEPTTHLDLPSSIAFLKRISHLAKAEEKTILLSSHDLALIFKMADRVVLLGDEGRYAIGSPIEVARDELMCGFLKTADISFENGTLIFNPDL